MTSIGLGGLAREAAAREALSGLEELSLAIRDFLVGGASRAVPVQSVLLAMVYVGLLTGFIEDKTRGTPVSRQIWTCVGTLTNCMICSLIHAVSIILFISH